MTTRRTGAVFVLLIGCFVLSGCAPELTIGKCEASVQPYDDIYEETQLKESCIIDIGDTVSVSGTGAWLEGSDIIISQGGEYILTGKTDNGSISVMTEDVVKLMLNDAQISNKDGFAIYSLSDKLILDTIGESSLTGSGGEYNTAVFSGGNTVLEGSGRLYINGGLYSQSDILYKKVTINKTVTVSEGGRLISGSLIVNE